LDEKLRGFLEMAAEEKRKQGMSRKDAPHRGTFRMSFVACSTIIAQVYRSTWGETCLPRSVKHFRSAVSV
jgi:hypothetical protein